MHTEKDREVEVERERERDQRKAVVVGGTAQSRVRAVHEEAPPPRDSRLGSRNDPCASFMAELKAARALSCSISPSFSILLPVSLRGAK